MSQLLVLCEGFSDRAFLKGLLKRLGAVDLGQGAKGGLGPGSFVFRAPNGASLVVVPMKVGIPAMYESVAALLEQQSGKVSRTVVLFDHDGVGIPYEQRRNERTTELQRRMGVAQKEVAPFRANEGDVDVGLWWAAGTSKPMLESVIEQALLETEKGPAIERSRQFLVTSGAIGGVAPFVYCGGWIPDRFGDAFFEHVWDSTESANALMKVLSQSPVVDTLKWLWT